MVPIKFTSLVIGLLLVLPLTHAQQARAMNGIGLAMAGEDGLLVQEELLDGKPNAAARTTGLGGRKMVVNRVTRKGIDVKGVNREYPKISGANHSVGNCELEGKGGLDVKCRTGDESIVSFVTFSADYHVPNRHPPKNN